jgi:adhesin transport system outer membrane protein
MNPPAVQLAEAQRAIAQADLRVADANLLPTLSLDGAVGRGIDARSRLPGENGVSTSVIATNAPSLWI